MELKAPKDHEIFSYRIASCLPTISFEEQNSPSIRPTEIRSALRFWWRIVKAPSVGYNYVKLRKKEFELFGSIEEDAKKSKVLIRLDPNGKVKPIGITNQPLPIREEFKYLKNKVIFYIPSSKPSHLSIITPRENQEELKLALKLFFTFGSIGTKSRNGFGSFYSLDTFKQDRKESFNFVKNNKKELSWCMYENKWPASFAKDEKGPLIWISQQEFKNWNTDHGPLHLIRQLKESISKINFEEIRPLQQDKRGKRIPGQIRFNLLPIEDRGEINFQVICYQLPYSYLDIYIKNKIQFEFWKEVHFEIDRDSNWTRAES